GGRSGGAAAGGLRGGGLPPRQLRPLALLALLLALTAAVGLVVSRSRWVQRPRTFAAPRPVAIVLEAANLTGDSSLDWLSTAVPEALTAALEPIRGVRLVPARIVAERQVSLGTATAPSFPNWDEPRRPAGSLGATVLVVLTFHRDQDSLRWEAQIHRAPSRTALASATELSPAEDVSSVADRLAAKLTTDMQWQKGESLLRSSLIPRRPLPETPLARRLFVEGLRRYARYDRREARVLVKRAILHEPGFLEALPLLLDIELESKLGTSQDEAERGLKRLAVLPAPERQLSEAAALNVLGRNDEAAERFAALLGPTPDDFELGLQRAWAAPTQIAYQQLAALRALPPPLGTDPRIDLCEAENRRIAMELPEALRAVDHGPVEPRRRGDRMTVSASRERRASALYRLGRIDEMEEALLSAEREALAAGAGASARELRLGRAWRLDEAGRLKAASQLLRQVLAELPPLGE